jgi:uncharacterized membrane protein YhaH (DUF805 family)
MFMEKPPKVQEILLIFLAVPRLHDIGRSGWLALPPLILEVVGVIACVAYLPPESAQVAFGVIALVLAGLMILLGIVPGDPMPNRFGEPPPPGVGLSKMAGDQR